MKALDEYFLMVLYAEQQQKQTSKQTEQKH